MMEEKTKKDVFENKKEVLDNLKFIKYVIDHIELFPLLNIKLLI